MTASDGVVLSAADVERASGPLAAAIHGVWRESRPPRIGHLFRLVPAGAVALRAIERSGGIAAPAHPDWGADRQERYLAAVRPDMLLLGAPTDGAESAGSRALRGLPGWNRVRVGPELAHPVELRVRPELSDPVGLPEGTGVLLTTSGTTGAPKVVCHAWTDLRAAAGAAAARLDYGPEDTWLATLAWAHIGGLAVALRASTRGGRLAFGPGRFEAEAVGAALRALRVTHVSLVPVMLRRLLDAGAPAPDTLRCAVVGGAWAPPALVRRALSAGWPVALIYGLTEAGSQVTAAPPDAVRRFPGHVGFPLDGCEVRLGAEGRIEVRSPWLCRGAPGDPAPGRAEGWLATDDFGAWDPEAGLRITGRAATRIVTGGTNVDPVEVEAVLYGHEAIREACVVGLPDEEWGEIVAAIVVLERPPDGEEAFRAPGGRDRGAAAEPAAELVEWAARRLEGPRRPRAWFVVEELPRLPNGKVDRARVRERAARRRARR